MLARARALRRPLRAVRRPPPGRRPDDGSRRASRSSAPASTPIADDVLEPDQLRPRLRIDAPLHLKAITHDLVQGLDSMGPFGLANPRPIFHAGPGADRRRPPLDQGAASQDDVQPGGAALPRHGLAGRRARAVPRASTAPGVNLAFSLDRNEYQGETYLELMRRRYQEPRRRRIESWLRHAAVRHSQCAGRKQLVSASPSSSSSSQGSSCSPCAGRPPSRRQPETLTIDDKAVVQTLGGADWKRVDKAGRVLLLDQVAEPEGLRGRQERLRHRQRSRCPTGTAGPSPSRRTRRKPPAPPTARPTSRPPSSAAMSSCGPATT